MLASDRAVGLDQRLEQVRSALGYHGVVDLSSPMPVTAESTKWSFGASASTTQAPLKAVMSPASASTVAGSSVLCRTALASTPSRAPGCALFQEAVVALGTAALGQGTAAAGQNTAAVHNTVASRCAALSQALTAERSAVPSSFTVATNRSLACSSSSQALSPREASAAAVSLFAEDMQHADRMTDETCSRVEETIRKDALAIQTLQAHVAKLEGGLEAGRISARVFEDQLVQDIAALNRKSSSELQQNNERRRKIVQQFETQNAAQLVETQAKLALLREDGEKTRAVWRDVGERIVAYGDHLREQEVLRKDCGDRIEVSLDGQLTKIGEELQAIREVRFEAETSIMQSVENMFICFREDLQRESQDREISQERLLDVLETATQRLEGTFPGRRRLAVPALHKVPRVGAGAADFSALEEDLAAERLSITLPAPTPACPTAPPLGVLRARDLQEIAGTEQWIQRC